MLSQAIYEVNTINFKIDGFFLYLKKLIIIAEQTEYIISIDDS